MPQFFKGDEEELKYYNSGNPIITQLEAEKDEFFDDAFNCFILGELLWDGNYTPLARAIPREIFRESFSAVFEAFESAGTFESYLTVFRKIFGEDVEVTFTVPSPGKLMIDIVAIGFVIDNFVAQVIEDNEYVYYDMIDEDDDNIVFESIKGFESEYELKQMLFELVPDGIYTEITLTLGE